jgi:hypothetical protein
MAVLAFMLTFTMVAWTQDGAPVERLAATTANTSSSGEAVRFDVLRWSTDAERDQVFTAIGADGDSAALLGLLQKAPTVGYIWTSESAGYPVRYAYRVPTADGGERVILAIDRQLGMYEPQRWKLASTATRTDYPFTVIELHLSKAGTGEGKTSLTAKVVADKDAKSIALENYAAAPVVFQGVKK